MILPTLILSKRCENSFKVTERLDWCRKISCPEIPSVWWSWDERAGLWSETHEKIEIRCNTPQCKNTRFAHRYMCSCEHPSAPRSKPASANPSAPSSVLCPHNHVLILVRSAPLHAFLTGKSVYAFVRTFVRSAGTGSRAGRQNSSDVWNLNFVRLY